MLWLMGYQRTHSQVHLDQVNRRVLATRAKGLANLTWPVDGSAQDLALRGGGGGGGVEGVRELGACVRKGLLCKVTMIGISPMITSVKPTHENIPFKHSGVRLYIYQLYAKCNTC